MSKTFLILFVCLLLMTGFGCHPFSSPDNEVNQIIGSTDVFQVVSAAVDNGNEIVSPDRVAENLPTELYKAQIGKVYQLGKSSDAILFVFVLQKNMNYPLTDLPAGVETSWGGILVSTNNGKSWENFLTYNNPIFGDGFTARHNPVGIFIENKILFVDVADALGAGSGEGHITRLAFTAGGVWKKVGCYYLVPEIYFDQVNGRDDLEVSDNCLLEL